MFLVSAKEVGFNVSEWICPDGYNEEGTCFDLFTTDDSSRLGFISTANISSNWWLRSTWSRGSYDFHSVSKLGTANYSSSSATYVVVPAFVIG